MPFDGLTGRRESPLAAASRRACDCGFCLRYIAVGAH